MFDRLNRRSFLQAVVAVAASTSFGCSDDDDTKKPTADAKYFPQSVCSGDPRPDSVILWVRALDPDSAGADAPVRLEVSTGAEFSDFVFRGDFTALAANDHALKVKVTRLSARTTYYYRFVLTKNGTEYTTATGRTRTAPAAGADVPVKFAFASCQDYIGRYYNAWQRLLQLDEDLDFVVFLGDYIYETTGDKSFQSGNTERRVVFSEQDKALQLGSGESTYYAANALSNYRDLYKTLRTDKVIQQVHERYPFIIIWDDHEFSDDSWGSNATYLDGRAAENQIERKRNSERAFFEYIPLDNTASAEGAIDVASAPVYPNTRVYRDFDFGKHLKLAVSDYRTYRPDHLIPEDAYPGKVAVEASVLALALPTLPAPVQALLQSETFAYTNLDAPENAMQKAVLQGAYVQQAVAAGLNPAQADAKAQVWVSGQVSLFYANQVLAAVNAAREAAGQPAIPLLAVAGTLRGLAYVHLGKGSLFNIQGSRYIVVKPIYDLFSALRYATSAGLSEDALGATQQAWLQNQLKAANTWKIVVSSVSMTSMVFDLSAKADIPDPTLRQVFYFNADQWDGFPAKKQELLGFIAQNQVKNAMFISGDIHASFASVEGGVPALTAPAITSGSIKELAGLAVIGAGYGPGSAVYKYVVTELNESLLAGNPGMRYVNGDAHGFVVLEVKGDEALAAFHLIPSTEVTKDYSVRGATELQAQFTRVDFRVQHGTVTKL
ncbi:alkaline phosphatase D family protein [Myxococcus sp. K38C18041901]|uniref:alkaline phosphatase D family protein n=1 Tax=Myxococcus guangdongensis TaxID=2906760 RepID=UPI0020A70ECA|nr:alkaline phosphatase D family protein [Myxococcus guangdongensis]MCP3058219.1 alkaline phosphatase D family protein [Myxococcus guangdongensis]